MPRNYGHRKGVETARRAIEYFAGRGVGHLTLFAFSSENWKRPAEEVNGLMTLFAQSLKQHLDTLDEEQIRVRFIGPRQPLGDKLCQLIESAEATTRDNRRLTLNVALNYGGHWDIVNAAQALARRVQAGEIDPAQIDSDHLAAELSLADIPDPDLFIRTGGEKRVSNFLLWQLAYTELYFCDCLWPDFAEADMQAALDEYARRQRRFGKTGDQLETPA